MQQFFPTSIPKRLGILSPRDTSEHSIRYAPFALQFFVCINLRGSAVKYLSFRKTGRYALCALLFAAICLRESAVNFLLKVILCDLCGSTLLTTLSPSKGVSAVNRLLSESMCLNRRLVSYGLAHSLFNLGTKGAGAEFPLEVNAPEVRGILLVATIKYNAAIWWQCHIVHITNTEPRKSVVEP